MDRSTRFKDSWLYGVVCDHAAAFLRGDLKRIVAIHPPGTYKSGVWSVSLVPFAWGFAPWMRFICVSNEKTLVTELSRKSRDIIDHEYYRQLFNPEWRLRSDQNTQQFFTNTATGTRQGVSVGASIIGKKAHRIIVDDLHDAKKVQSATYRKSDKDWFSTALFDRMIDMAESGIAVIGHRVHKDDIAGQCINEGWPTVHIPEVWQESFRKYYPVGKLRTDPRKEGERLRESVGPKQEEEIRLQGNGIWETKYQGNPTTAEGTLFPKHKLGWLKAIPVGTVGVRFWDTAATVTESSSWTCGVGIGRQPSGRFLIFGVERERMRPGERNALILSTAHLDRLTPGLTVMDTVIEHPGGSGGVEAAEIMIQALSGFNAHIRTVSGKGSKLYRAGPFSAQWLAGNVDILDEPWARSYVERMENVHNSTEQDDMDASSGAFNELVGVGKPGELPDTATKTHAQKAAVSHVAGGEHNFRLGGRVNTEW